MLVLNKVDLVPRTVEQAWKDMLAREHPVVSISARYPGNLREVRGRIRDQLRDHPSWRGESLHCNVLVADYPNSGKSTLIDALVEGKKQVSISSQAGHTRGIQKVALDEKIYLIDTPGVIPPSSDDDEIHMALDTCSIASQKILDKDTITEEIVRRVGLVTLNTLYKIEATDVESLVDQVGRARGFLVKGGRVNEAKVHELLVMDWQRNMIPYYHEPDPASPRSPGTPRVGVIKDPGAKP